MQCPNPIAVENNEFYGRDIVPCGSCLMCLANSRKDWSFRLSQELKSSNSGSFITLTYDEDALPINKYGNPTLQKKDFQTFMRALRHANIKQAMKYHKFKTMKEARSIMAKITYYAIGEYGPQTLRPHYHALLFNHQTDLQQDLPEIWKHGHTKIDPITPARINYVSGYVITKKDFSNLSDREPQFNLMSKGLGKNYLNNANYHKQNLSDAVRNSDGTKQKLPRYYKDKIFTDSEKESIRQSKEDLIRNGKNEEFNKRLEQGLDPYEYKQQQKQLLREKLNKTLTKNKTL